MTACSLRVTADWVFFLLDFQPPVYDTTGQKMEPGLDLACLTTRGVFCVCAQRATVCTACAAMVCCLVVSLSLLFVLNGEWKWQLGGWAVQPFQPLVFL